MLLGVPNRSSSLPILRIRVLMPVLEKLTTGFFMEREGKSRVWLPFRYGMLADFCYCCGSLLHMDSACSKKLDTMCGPLDPSEAYGSWLRTGFFPYIPMISLAKKSNPSVNVDKENIPPEKVYQNLPLTCELSNSSKPLFRHRVVNATEEVVSIYEVGYLTSDPMTWFLVE